VCHMDHLQSLILIRPPGWSGKYPVCHIKLSFFVSSFLIPSAHAQVALCIRSGTVRAHAQVTLCIRPGTVRAHAQVALCIRPGTVRAHAQVALCIRPGTVRAQNTLLCARMCVLWSECCAHRFWGQIKPQKTEILGPE